MSLQELLGEVRTRLVRLYGARLKGVILCGSVARGEDTPDSDIDLLVLLDGPIALGQELERIIEVLYPVGLESDRCISAWPVDEHDYLEAKYPLFINAKREGVAV